MRTAIVRIAIAAALLLSSSARAEEAWVTTPTYRPHQTLFLVNWEIAGPIGSFGDYIDDTSLRGARSSSAASSATRSRSACRSPGTGSTRPSIW